MWPEPSTRIENRQWFLRERERTNPKEEGEGARRSTIETFDSPVPRPPPFQSMPTTPDTSRSGTKQSLLIVTLITTPAGSERQFIYKNSS